MSEGLKVKKIGATVNVSAEMMYEHLSWGDSRYSRRAIWNYEDPTPEAWERYRAALAGLEALKAYEATEWGGPDYGTEVLEPEPTGTCEYLETHKEWLARCAELMKEGLK